jgi:subtilisin family serine protease
MGQLRMPARRLVPATGLAALAAVVAFAAVPAFAAPTEGEIRNAGGKTAVANSYIAVLKPTSSLSARGVTATARELTARHNGSVKYTYHSALQGFATTMSEADAKKLAEEPGIEYVEQDHTVRMSGVQPNPPSWGLDRIDQTNLPLDNSYTYPNEASNVTAYIVDTGILTSHTTFGGRARHGRDTVDNDNDATDCQGHGTHVAGTVGGSQYGVAKAVKLVAVRVLNCQGSGTNAGVIAGVDWVTANAVKPAVANMSLGGGVNQALDDAVSRSIASGISYAVAAGNGDFLGRPANACGFSPARTPNAITVGATQRTDASATFSNFGPCLDIWAPGVGITSSWIGNPNATNTISGTSMAAPHVAGAAAVYLSANPTSSPQQVRDALVNGATNGKVTNPGAGSPNKLLRVIGTGGPDPSPTPTGSPTPSPTTSPDPGGYFENTTNVNIPDLGTVTSTIPVARPGNAPSTLKVGVDIKHSYRGDLVIDLLAPDGTAYRLKNSSGSDSADNVITTYTVNASSEGANGTWTLRVRDAYAADTGFIDKWSLQF